jgi:ectoine hydroxylase-related dioxygenase (phytanoyl-CoA dioxygenase family)
MKLTSDQLRSYRENGFLLLPGAFSAPEVAAMKAELPGVFDQESPARVKEASSPIVRSVYGSHRTHESFRQLSEDARLVEPAMQVVDSEVYVYQFKVNAKAAFAGDVWEWHQDYIFWRDEDGMPAPRVMNAALFLDEVNEFNGPMFFMPGSHREGVIDVRPASASAPEGGEPAWMSNVSAKLNYALDQPTVERLCNRYGMSCPKGPAGTMLLFDSNVVHGSSNNISPFNRVMVIATYNSVHNLPGTGRARRPDFLVSRDVEPVRPVQPGQFVH